MQDIELYRDTKRNEKCPCDSGKIFKICCMKEYREAKKRGDGEISAKFSTFSPFKPLSYSEAELFMNYYDQILLFSYTYRTDSKTIVADDMMEFLTNERKYFYEDKENILEEFITMYPPEEEEIEIIEAIKESRYEIFILMEYGTNTAVITDTNNNTYSVQALSTPFDKMFTKKPIIMQTVLISYKDRYIMDGKYGIVQDKFNKAFQKDIDKIPSLGYEVSFQKKKTISTFLVSLNLTVFCDALHFEEMENILQHNIPADFTQKMVDMFDDTPFERVSFASSFIRTMDYLSETNDDKMKQTILINGLSVSNYEINGDTSVIPYEILEMYYKQKSLDKSISKGVYQNVQNAKMAVRHGEKNILQASSFYSMVGVFYIQNDNIDKFEFLKYLDTFETRKVFTKEIEQLFETINKTIDFEITPIYLDFSVTLDSVIDKIDEFRDFMGGLFVKSNWKKMRDYSLYKGLRPKRFGLF
ncbi:MAG: SEC-C domain-containing protein [Sulfurovum sp.]